MDVTCPLGRPMAAAALICGLAACQDLAAQRERFEAQISESCRAQGFTEGTDAFRTCLLLERTNARLSVVESRLDQLEFQVRRLDSFGWLCPRCR